MFQPYHQFVCDNPSPLNTQGFRVPHTFRLQNRKGIIPLWKDDFQALPNGGLLLHDSRFVNKECFVVFIVNYCMPCQDTKQMWQAFAIEATELMGTGPFIQTDYVQYLMFKRRDGILVEYRGQLNIQKLNYLLAQKGLNL